LEGSSFQPGTPPETALQLALEVSVLISEINSKFEEMGRMENELGRIGAEIDETLRAIELFSYVPSNSLPGILGINLAISILQEELADLCSDAEQFAIYIISAADYNQSRINYLRNRAVDLAWRREYEDVKNGGDGITRVWNLSQKKELLSNAKRPRVKGFEGHHIDSVEYYPEKAGDVNNIRMVEGSANKSGTEHNLLHYDENGNKNYPSSRVNRAKSAANKMFSRISVARKKIK
jgi:hypothetical protein